MKEALALAKVKPLIIDYDDLEFPQHGERAVGSIDYEALLAAGDPDFAWRMPEDEWEAITLNYTSGTTGNPKGVVYHHRGAALMCYANMRRNRHGRAIPSTCGRCRCSTATAGASPGRSRRRRHARLPALGARQGDVRRHRRPQGDAPLRRADRHVDAAQRQAGGAPADHPPRRLQSRRRPAARGRRSTPWSRRASTSPTSTG